MPRPFSSEAHEGKDERKQKREARSNGFLDKVFLANEKEFKIDKTRLLKKNALGRRARQRAVAPVLVWGREPRGARRDLTGPKGAQNPKRALRRAAPGRG